MNTYFDLDNAEVVVDPVKTVYGYESSIRGAVQGITGGVASYGDYVYYGDDSGVLQCVDVNTMQPVWAMDLGESMMCTPALETDDDGNVYLYTGTALSLSLIQISAQRGAQACSQQRAAPGMGRGI